MDPPHPSSLLDYSAGLSILPFLPEGSRTRSGTAKQPLGNHQQQAPPQKCTQQTPTDQAKVNEMLTEQTHAMAKEISNLKSMIGNLANQMGASMAAFRKVVIGKVDSIHKIFTK